MPARLERMLVVAFKYPPFAAVGGKRWAKLSKYLARQGIQVHVLTVPWGADGAHTLDDVTHPNIKIHRIPSLGFHRFQPRTADGSLRSRIHNRAYRTIKSLPRLSQQARSWGPALAPALAWLVRRHRIQVVVCTGAPFWANRGVAKSKWLLGGVPVVQEFRDPWSDLPQYAEESSADAQHERRAERAVLDSADMVVTVTEGLSQLIRDKDVEAQVVTISNGYDPEDVFESPRTPRPFRLMHGGNLYVGRDEPLAAFLAVVDTHAEEFPDLTLRFRGGFPDAVRERYRRLEDSGVLEVLPAVPAAQYARELAESFGCLQFNARHFPYLVSTKIYEYGASRRPVLSVNYGGEVETLVREHSLGWSADATDERSIHRMLTEARDTWLRDSSFESSPEDIERYDYEQIADAYRSALDDLIGRRASS